MHIYTERKVIFTENSRLDDKLFEDHTKIKMKKFAENLANLCFFFINYFVDINKAQLICILYSLKVCGVYDILLQRCL